MTLGKLIVNTGMKLANICDMYTEKVLAEKHGNTTMEKNKLLPHNQRIESYQRASCTLLFTQRGRD